MVNLKVQTRYLSTGADGSRENPQVRTVCIPAKVQTRLLPNTARSAIVWASLLGVKSSYQKITLNSFE
jgi:hypothetical protein